MVLGLKKLTVMGFVMTNKQREQAAMKRRMKAARRIEQIKDMQRLGVLRGEKWGGL